MRAEVRSRRDARKQEEHSCRYNEEHEYDVPHRAPVLAHDSDSDERPISYRELHLKPVMAHDYALPPRGSADRHIWEDTPGMGAPQGNTVHAVSPIAVSGAAAAVRWSDKL
jgi:hypothetical protein